MPLTARLIVTALVLFSCSGQFYVQFMQGEWVQSMDGENWTSPMSGWIPDRIAEAPDRLIVSLWPKRGYAFEFGDWQTFEYPNAGYVAWGPSPYAQPLRFRRRR